MLDIVNGIFSVGQKLFALRDELSKAKAQRKEPVAVFLMGVADCIEGTSAELAQGRYPHGRCMELLTHAQGMGAAIGDLVGDKKAEELGLQLQEVYQIERLCGELAQDSDHERTRKLSVLDQSAGLFRATAAVVRASP